MGPRGPSRASKYRNPALVKSLKQNCFFNVFGVQGLPRQPGKAQEGSPEAPKELQDLQKKDQQMDPKNITFSDQFWDHFGDYLWAKKCFKN